MQNQHVPSIGPRYWGALCIASVCGANMGDFIAGRLGLGHVRGLPILAVILAIIFLIERRDRNGHQVYYWSAIIVVRTAATNLADIDINLGWVWKVTGLTILLVIAVLSGRFLAPQSTIEMCNAGGAGLPKTDSYYWASMLVAGTLGTVIADVTAYGSGLGLEKASIYLSVILGAWFYISRGVLRATPFYWITIVLVRAAGTAVGDYLARSLGLTMSTILTGQQLVITVSLGDRKVDPNFPPTRSAR